MSENKSQNNQSQNQPKNETSAIDQEAIDKAVADALAKRDADEAQRRADAEKEAEEAKKPFTVTHGKGENQEKYDFPGTEKGNYIVRHSRVTTHDSGAVTEDPGSVRIQIYRPEVYAELIHEDEKSGKKNGFVEMGEKAIVLHDPTK